MHYVEKAIKDLENQLPKEGREESFLEKLVKINKNVAIVMSADAVLAGGDTSSSAAVAVFYCLAKNQDKQEKLREESRQILPNKDEQLTPDKMKNMPYLRAVIKEGIRLYPPASGNIRKLSEDLVLSGYKVPKGTEVVMALMLMHKDEKQFVLYCGFICSLYTSKDWSPFCLLGMKIFMCKFA